MQNCIETSPQVTISELDADVPDDASGLECVGEMGSDFSVSEASGPWAAGWVPACPPGLLQCPHCMSFVPPGRFCEYCLSPLEDGSGEEVMAAADGAGSEAASSASTGLPRSSETELDSSGSDADSEASSVGCR